MHVVFRAIGRLLMIPFYLIGSIIAVFLILVICLGDDLKDYLIDD